jgi:hypothetical protein
MTAKPFSFSYSKLKNYESCPKKCWHHDYAPKDHPDKLEMEKSDELTAGNRAHKALASRCSVGASLPKDLEQHEPWCARITSGVTPGAKLLVEQQLAITEDFGKTTWFGKDVWFRAIADVLKIVGPVALIVDWKTGKIVEDSVQLALAAACVFAHYPEVQRVRSVFVWLKYDCETPETFDRNNMATMWRGLWPRIESLKQAYETSNFPPTPSGLCKKHCDVTTCQFWGKGSR